jgi:hypothetical protein
VEARELRIKNLELRIWNYLEFGSWRMEVRSWRLEVRR